MAQIDIKQIRGVSQGSILFLGTNSVVSEDFNSLRWQSDNKTVYIGNDNSYVLEVGGTVSTNGLRISSGAQDNYVLISDSSGNASWTASNRLPSPFSYKEIPLGVIDDVNTLFILSGTPEIDSEHLFYNGLLQHNTLDYTISGSTITFFEPPRTGSVLVCTYRNIEN